ncbi:hypothetical protein [Pseudotabrizicola sp.]|uniref:hypothetical protein n=1 Tax=Pseudotabrizicola sp. TaxID=2939647 RepID=UPI00271DF6B6|nr:hypothetical protein [Pseudotabrizicola sp.]MDO8882905.1 hypothetical protein [Pseudotabrizicola sp.]
MSKIDFKRIISAGEVETGLLLAARQDAVQTVTKAVEVAMARHTAQVPLAEMLSWGEKEQSARTVLADPDAQPDALLISEAAFADETVTDLALRIVNTAETQRAMVGALTGLRRKALAEIAAAKGPEAIATVLEDARRRIAAV